MCLITISLFSYLQIKAIILLYLKILTTNTTSKSLTVGNIRITLIMKISISAFVKSINFKRNIISKYVFELIAFKLLRLQMFQPRNSICSIQFNTLNFCFTFVSILCFIICKLPHRFSCCFYQSNIANFFKFLRKSFSSLESNWLAFHKLHLVLFSIA